MTDIKQSPMKYSKYHWHPEIYRIDNIVQSLKAKNLYNPEEGRSRSHFDYIIFSARDSSSRQSPSDGGDLEQRRRLFNGLWLEITLVYQCSRTSGILRRCDW